mmetsp:Transcript_73751/g.171037  ORF Transcript_73751/g.171037 Transcript_73751/m.171037 type:complete len:436 (-) Transcript_73751:81-1388(-)
MNEPLIVRRGGSHQECPLWPLYCLTFLRVLAYAVAALPACVIRVHELTVAAGGDEAWAAMLIGAMSALRHLSEFVATQLLPPWSEKVGRQPVLLVCSASFAAESAMMALCTSAWLVGVAHAAGGLFFSAGALESVCIRDRVCDEESSVAAHRWLFAACGGALVLGPVLSGVLSASFGGVAPFLVAHMLALVSVLGAAAFLPEYLPKHGGRRRRFSASMSEQPRISYFAEEPSLCWSCCALALSGLGMAVFAAVSVMWMEVVLRWGTQQMGWYLGFGGCLQLVAQAVLLPCLARVTRRSDSTVAQICLVANGLKFVALAGIQESRWMFILLVAAMPGFCGTPALSSLCMHNLPQALQKSWDRNLSALNTVASALGALAGSYMLALGMRGSRSLGMPMLFAAACCFLAGACVVQAKSYAKGERPHRLAAPPPAKRWS